MYRPTFAVDAIGRDEPKALEIGLEAMGYLLEALVKINRAHLRRFPNTPRLYKSGVRYDPMDPPEGNACGDDDWADVVRVLETKGANGHPIGDCFPVGTLLLRDDYSLVPIEEIKVGDKIWGRDAWTTVEVVAYKGLLSVDAVTMNNGSVVQLTGDHHIYVGRCETHKNSECSCILDGRKVERIRLRELKEKDVLVTPKSVEFTRKAPLSDTLLRVNGVKLDVAEIHCYDIQTSDHYVYLPEHDVTVSNCEELACWRAAELQQFHGINATPHVFLRRDWIKDEDGQSRRRHLYHIVVKWPPNLSRYANTVKRMNGLLIEDPSKVLGM